MVSQNQERLATVERWRHVLAAFKTYWPAPPGLYDKQRLVLRSVVENKQTVVVAGNQLGKDYVAGAIALVFFLHPEMFFDPSYVMQIEKQRLREGKPYRLAHTRRVLTTSPSEDHLKVLWGEIGRFLSTSKVPLSEADGGPLVVNYQEIRFREEREKSNPYNYLMGMVAQKPEKFGGHHAAYTLFIGDEASGLADEYRMHAMGWMKKELSIGNAWDCHNFFRQAVMEGDLP